jgi:uncharacterized Zn finger protein
VQAAAKIGKIDFPQGEMEKECLQGLSSGILKDLLSGRGGLEVALALSHQLGCFSVADLLIAAREVTAMVSESRLYTVKVGIANVAKARWKALCADCSGGIDSLVELLQGCFSKAVTARICRQDTGLFPRPSEIRFACSCPDHASMCKHVAAVLYGVGARLDRSPELLFRLRAVDETEMLSNLEAALLDRRTQNGRTH